MIFSKSRERAFFYLFCGLSACPLLFSYYPPMVDLPQHAAQVAVFNNLTSPDFPYGDLFTVSWWKPYRGGYTILVVLSRYIPIRLAIKLLLAATLVAIPLSASRLRSSFGRGNPSWDWLLLPIGYGFAFQWGLLNFLVSVPFVLIYLLAVLRYSRTPSVRLGIGVGLFGLFLLYMHLLAAAFACGLALLYVVSLKMPWKRRLGLAAPIFTPAPLALAFLFRLLLSSQGVMGSGPWGFELQRLFLLLASSTGMPLTLTSVAVGVALFSLPLIQGARLTRDRTRLALFGAFLVGIFFGPGWFLGNAYTTERFAVFGLPLFLLVLDQSKTGRGFFPRASKILQHVLPIAILLGACVLFAGFERESRAYREVAREMEPGKRVLTMVFDRTPSGFSTPAYLHFPAWYQAEANGLVDFNFSVFGVLLRYKPEALSPISNEFTWQPETFDWNKHEGWIFDYFVVRSLRDRGPDMFSDAGCPVKLLIHREDWWLYGTELGSPEDQDSCFSLRLAAGER